MTKKYRITVLTHKRNDYEFNKVELLNSYINELDIPSSYKKQLCDDGYVHVPSKRRTNSLDVYIINEFDEYLEEYSNSLTRSQINISETNEKLNLLSKFVDAKDEMILNLKESHRQDLMINDMKNKAVLINFAIALTKNGGTDLFKSVEKEFFQNSNKEVLETYEKLFR